MKAYLYVVKIRFKCGETIAQFLRKQSFAKVQKLGAQLLVGSWNSHGESLPAQRALYGCTVCVPGCQETVKSRL